MRARGHGAARRWGIVGALVAALVATPSLIGALPASDADVSAADLRSAVLGSADVGFSGYAESAGGLALPVTDRLTSVADLVSDRTEMRVWWRGPTDHRVDVITAAGETSTRRDERGTWTWEYERATATRAESTPFALPAPADLLPTALGRRLLSEATDDELSRIGARSVSGDDALGVRLLPDEAASSVGRVDVWVDPGSGLPLQVQVYEKVPGGGVADLPALDTRFLDVEVGRPSAAVTAFTPPEGAWIREAREAEIVLEAGRRIDPVPLPDELAGLPRRVLEGVPPAIGLYGRGVTLLAVAPVPPGLARGLRNALAQSVDAVRDSAGTRLAAGPVGLMLLEPPGHGSYLLTGTVTLDALAAAAGQLPGGSS
jgi:outer membrane lipoprotein-sorting protein